MIKTLTMMQLTDIMTPIQELDLATAMFSNRAEVFGKILGWNVEIDAEGFEHDKFDEASPLYLISVDDAGAYQGSLRLLPTIGPNMLRDVFPFLLNGKAMIESPTIWESSRICVSQDAFVRTATKFNQALAELILGIVEVGMAAGVMAIVSVFDSRILRILRQAGCNPQIGEPHKIGDTLTYVGTFDLGNSPLDNIRKAVGITGSVLEESK